MGSSLLHLLVYRDQVHGPYIRIEINGSHALLSHDDVVDDITFFGWVKFIQSFEGFNL